MIESSKIKSVDRHYCGPCGHGHSPALLYSSCRIYLLFTFIPILIWSTPLRRTRPRHEKTLAYWPILARLWASKPTSVEQMLNETKLSPTVVDMFNRRLAWRNLPGRWFDLRLSHLGTEETREREWTNKIGIPGTGDLSHDSWGYKFGNEEWKYKIEIWNEERGWKIKNWNLGNGERKIENWKWEIKWMKMIIYIIYKI